MPITTVLNHSSTHNHNLGLSTSQKCDHHNIYRYIFESITYPKVAQVTLNFLNIIIIIIVPRFHIQINIKQRIKMTVSSSSTTLPELPLTCLDTAKFQNTGDAFEGENTVIGEQKYIIICTIMGWNRALGLFSVYDCFIHSIIRQCHTYHTAATRSLSLSPSPSSRPSPITTIITLILHHDNRFLDHKMRTVPCST